MTAFISVLHLLGVLLRASARSWGEIRSTGFFRFR
jgi:hypothetical protein